MHCAAAVPLVSLALCQRPPFANSSYLIVQPSRNIPPEPKPAFFNLLCFALPGCHRGPFYFAVSPLAWCPCALRVGSPLEDWPATTSLRRHPGLCWTPSVDRSSRVEANQSLSPSQASSSAAASFVAGVNFGLVSLHCVHVLPGCPSTPAPAKNPPRDIGLWATCTSLPTAPLMWTCNIPATLQLKACLGLHQDAFPAADV